MEKKWTRILVFSFLAIFALCGAAYAAGEGYEEVDAAQAKALMDKTPDLVVLDVSPNYAKGHLPKAINHPVGDGSLDKAIPGLDKNKAYLVYCHGEAPSIAGAKKLVAAGFKKVYRLKGEYKAWVAAGYPVEK